MDKETGNPKKNQKKKTFRESKQEQKFKKNTLHQNRIAYLNNNNKRKTHKITEGKKKRGKR